MLHIDTIETQQDAHTISIEDLAIRQAMDEIIQRTEENEKIF